MALQEALNKAIQEFGKGILTEQRLLNILNDYHGYDEMPYARFILKELQNDGTLARIVKMVSFDQLKTKQILQRIHNRFGFDISSVEHIISQVQCAIERFQLIATQEDLDNAWTDDKGVKYSQDRKRLLKASDKSIINYSVREGTTVICSDAFFDCQSLIHLDLPEGITYIGQSAFEFCISLQRLVLPKSLRYMGINPFVKCNNIKYMICLSPHFNTFNHLILNKGRDHVIGYFGDNRYIKVPNGVIHIDENAFYFNEQVQSIVIPDSVEYIGDHAFRFCSSLQNLVIPNSVKSIGKEAFIECESLQSVTLPKQSNYLDFSYCPSLQSIKLPENINSIPDYAFSNCHYLESIHFPYNITSIGKKAFYDCCLLQHIEWLDQIKSIEDEAFKFCVSLKSIVFPKNLARIGKDAFMRCDSLESITFYNKVRQIDEGAFKYCESLRAIIIPQGMRTHFEQLFPLEYHELLIEQL